MVKKYNLDIFAEDIPQEKIHSIVYSIMLELESKSISISIRPADD